MKDLAKAAGMELPLSPNQRGQIMHTEATNTKFDGMPATGPGPAPIKKCPAFGAPRQGSDAPLVPLENNRMLIVDDAEADFSVMSAPLFLRLR